MRLALLAGEAIPEPSGITGNQADLTGLRLLGYSATWLSRERPGMHSSKRSVLTFRALASRR